MYPFSSTLVDASDVPCTALSLDNFCWYRKVAHPYPAPFSGRIFDWLDLVTFELARILVAVSNTYRYGSV